MEKNIEKTNRKYSEHQQDGHARREREILVKRKAKFVAHWETNYKTKKEQENQTNRNHNHQRDKADHKQDPRQQPASWARVKTGIFPVNLMTFVTVSP